MGGEEGYERRLCVKAEGIVVKYDGMEVRKVENGGKQRG